MLRTTMAIIDRIKYDGPANGQPWLIYKYPSEDFVLGSQLIVNQSQEALFFKGGKALDLFGAGTHTLSTGNIPILKSIVNIPFGGKTPFSAEIYYVNTTSRLDMKWGTSVPFQVTDPKHNIIVSVRAFGQYGVSIADSRLFITQIVGAVSGGHVTTHDYVTKYFSGIINTKIKEIVSTYILDRNVSVLEITKYIGEISEVSKTILNEEFSRFGIEIKNFYLESVNFPNDDIGKLKAVYDKKMELNILGEDYYRQRSFDVLEKLAENDAAASTANAGIGLGMGLGAGVAAGNAFVDLAGNIRTTPSHTRTSTSDEKTVECPGCKAKNPITSKFCGECGDKLLTSIQCHHCHAELAPGTKFCGQCGQPQGFKKCSGCGHQNPASNGFCEECGKKL